MSDQPADRVTFTPQPDPLESRLDALGRSLVEAEVQHTDPPRAYLEAAAARAVFGRIRVWGPRVALAAAVALAGIAAFILSQPAPVPTSGGSVPIAIGAPGPEASGPDPTIANLHTANRSVASPDHLQLLGGAPTPNPVDSAPAVFRASDTRSPERIDALIDGD